jgi:hypothetical protein
MNKQSKLEVDENGNKFWKLNGKYHREDGPAIEGGNGTILWYLNGFLHRVDGPAIEWSNGSKAWFIKGCSYLTKDEWFQALTLEQQYNYLWVL